jgi:NAD(P)-dependent dehydrogenase (short-subunit alcohol dehydrogenase family)
LQKTVIITGGTSGIGLQTARQLADERLRIVMIGHNPARTEVAVQRLRRYAPSAEVETHNADLSDLSAVRRLASVLAEAVPRIDALINNVGAIYSERQVTPDGLERTFALNHLAGFALTHLLREKLIASAPSRVVNVTSDVHRFASLDFSDLQYERGYGAWKAYARSKLCNILFTRELARRLGNSGVTANCFHPGFNAGRFGDDNNNLFAYGYWLLKRLAAASPRKGATRSVHLALSPDLDGVTGCYFQGREPSQPSALARDDAMAERLWRESERLMQPPAA